MNRKLKEKTERRYLFSLRTPFPLNCFTVRINKAQGQSAEDVGIDLR
jgi:hypothetical protein